MSPEYEEKEIHLFLDFQGKVDLNLGTSKHFLRVADLDTPNPLVQINDLLYKGSYEDCIGTNLFFTEQDESTTNKSCFEKETSISLKYILSQNKIINLKCVKIKNIEEEETSENTEVNLNFNQDYSALLKKLNSGALNIEDLIKGTAANTNNGSTKQGSITQRQEEISIEGKVECMDAKEINTTKTEEDCDSLLQVELEKKLEQVPIEYPDKLETSSSKLLEKYEKLRQLARRPVYREIEPEKIADCEDGYKKLFEYHNIERQILQRGDSFPVLDVGTDHTAVKNAADIDRCILHNIIPPFNKTHLEINDEDKNKIFRIENFEFLSLPARLFVLENQLEQVEASVKNATESELKEVDEFGRTPQDTLGILKKLVTNLKVYLNTIKNPSK